MENMVFQSIYIDGNPFQMEVASSDQDIGIGMSRYRSPPSYGMIFLIKGRNMLLTMNGVSYPLDIFFLDRYFNLISRKRSYPGDPLTSIPKGTYYMLEFPIGMV